MLEHMAKVVILSIIACIVMAESMGEAETRPCRLNEARSISCAAASRSYEIDSQWPKAQGIFEACMHHLGCVEPKKWDGICR